jgi:hypothetical protein
MSPFGAKRSPATRRGNDGFPHIAAESARQLYDRWRGANPPQYHIEKSVLKADFQGQLEI